MRTDEALVTPGATATATGVPPALPAWPYLTLFTLYPLWWVLGVTPFVLALLGGVGLIFLRMRGLVRLPRLWLWWVAFLIWSLASVVMIDSPGRLVGFAQRWSALVGASLLVVYVFNARETLPRRRVLRAMAVMLGWVAVGGYLGMLVPYGRISTPVLAVLPPSLATNEFVLELFSPRFSEVQHPWGAVSAFVRPSAPFPYTNTWGHAFVLLVPVVAALAVRASVRERWLLGALVVAAVPPALATLNRGIFIGLGVATGYVALRFVRRVRPVQLVRIALAGLLVAGVVRASGVLSRISERTTTSSTTQDRATLYRETFTRTLESPLLGWGAPRPSATLNVSAGTQGHLWYLMFSHGFVGLALFLGFVWGLAVITRRVVDPESTLLHAVLVVIGVMLFFYGVDGVHLVVALTCGVLLLRPEPWGTS